MVLEIEHSLSTELEQMQKWLRYLGYFDISDDMPGIDYGGSTRTAVQLFQPNYGMLIDGKQQIRIYTIKLQTCENERAINEG